MAKKGAFFRIQIANGKSIRSEEIEKDTFTIGRGDSSDFRVPTAGVSRSHLSVAIKNGKVFLTDLGSSNGTKVSGNKIAPNQPFEYKDDEPIVLGLDPSVISIEALTGVREDIADEDFEPSQSDKIDFGLSKSKKASDADENEQELPHVELPPLPANFPPKKEARPETVVPTATSIPVLPTIPPVPKAAPAVVPPVPVAVAVSVVKPAVTPKKVEASTDLFGESEGDYEHTKIDPNFKKVINAQNQAMQEQVLEEAKGNALRLKIAATTDAAKILQDAKDRARTEISKAREKAEQIVEKATDQAVALTKKSEADATELREAMQTAIAKVHTEIESRAEAVRREAREKGETIIAESQTKAEKILSTARVSVSAIKGDAQKEADSLIGAALQKAAELKAAAEADLKTLYKDERKKALDAVSDAQAEADQILTEARSASALIRRNIEIEMGATRKHLEDEAAKIKLEAQEEAADYIAAAQHSVEAQKKAIDAEKENLAKNLAELKATGEAEAAKVKTEAEKESRVILARARREAKAQAEELLLVRETAEREIADLRLNHQAELKKIKEEAEEEARLIVKQSEDEVASQRLETEKLKSEATTMVAQMRAQVEEELHGQRAEVSKLRSQTKKEVSEIKANAKTEANELLKRAEIVGEKTKEKYLQDAAADAQIQKNRIVESAEEEKAQILSLAEIERQDVQKAIRDLKTELAQNEEKAKTVAEQNKGLEAKNKALEAEFAKLSLKLQESQTEADDEIKDLNEQVSAVKKTLSTQQGELEKVKTETKDIRDQVQHATQSLDQSKREKEAITAEIEVLKKTEVSLQKNLEIQTQQSNAEKLRLKAQVEKEVQAFKDQAMSEIKALREKAQSDFEQKKTDLTSELDQMRRTELETIKGLRGIEENKLILSRKHHTLEIAKALETYLVSQIKQITGSKELPKSFATIFADLKTIVGTVLENKLPGALTQGPITPKTSHKKRNAALGLGATIALALVALYSPLRGENAGRLPASDLFIERLKEKEAQKPQFNPLLTDLYKPTYTENVLYTRDYVNFKLNADNQAKWIKELNKYFVNDLGLSENAIVKFISVESSLVSQLKDLRAVVHVENQAQDIAKMTDLEKTTMPDFIEVLGSERKYKAFRAFEKSYFETNRQPASENPPKN